MICSLAYVLELVVFPWKIIHMCLVDLFAILWNLILHTWVSSGSFQIILYLPNSSLLSNRFTWMNRHLVTDIQHTDRWLADDTWPVWATLHHLVSIRARSWLGFRPRGCLMSTRTHVLSRGVPWQQSRQSRGFSLTARGRHDVKQVKRKPFDCTVPRAISRRERVGTLSWRAAGWAKATPTQWIGNVVIVTKFSSPAATEVVIWNFKFNYRWIFHQNNLSVTGTCRNENGEGGEWRKSDQNDDLSHSAPAVYNKLKMLIQNFNRF